MTAKRILFVGGGTPGHIAPLVAVMEKVMTIAPDTQCNYAGLHGDLNAPVFANLPFEFDRHAITAGKLNRFVTIRHLTEFLKLGRGFVEAYELLRAIKPDCVFSKGGFVSIPVALMAKWMHIPVYSHESDVIPGIANRIVAKRSINVFTSYPVESYRRLPKEKLLYVGQPVRERFFAELAFPTELAGEKLDLSLPMLLITGSAQGAHHINELVSPIWSQLLQDFQIVHQAGMRDYTELLEKKLLLNEDEQKRLHVVQTIEDIAPFFHNSELVISRSGGVIAELAASKVATILIPLSTSAQNHQWENAQVLAKADAAVVLDEKILTSESLLAVIQELHGSAEKREKLQEHIMTFAKPEAAQEIAEILLAV